MIKNYFKTAFRNLIRNKNYTVVNIAGLAVGIAVCLIIFITIQYETSFDDFHKKKNRIYRVLTEYHHADAADIFYGKGVPMALPASLKANFPQAEKVAVVYTQGNDQLLALDDNSQPVKKFKEENGVFFTEPSLFEIFDFKWLTGNAASLKDPNSVVLTRATAEKYFGNWQDATGKTIKWNNSYILKVTGVLDDVPENTDLQLKVVIAIGTSNMTKSTDWNSTQSAFGCYVLLSPDVSEATFNIRLRALAKKMKAPDNKDSQIIQPLAKIHYDTKTDNFSGKKTSGAMINALWLIAAFILLIACVNFVNLSTAQAVNRSKEVGIRKVLGGNKRQLKIQFLAETFIIVLFSILLAACIAFLSLPYIGKILDKPLSFDIAGLPVIILFLSILAIAVTIIAGFYPSVILSQFNPVTALKSKMIAAGSKGITLRKGLVVFQFVIAQALIIGTLIIVKQMNYFTHQPLGFDKTAVVNVPFPADSIGISKLNYLHEQLSGIKGIEKISFSSNTPTEDDNDNWTTFKFDNALKETDFYAINKWADNEYVPTYHLPLIAGRNLNPSDTVREFLVNELLLKNLGITDPQAALNKQISLWDGFLKGTVVGVVKDFKARSFRRDLAPVLITTFKRGYSQAGIKLSTADASSVIKAIEKSWNKTFPDFVFEYKFLDDKIESFYKEEKQLSDLYKIFATMAIFLSCLGLFGLASFMAVQRIKEVGIRKVLGASVSSVVYLFSKEFVMLIGIAFIIASPVAWYFMHRWLQDYVYRINISWWIFIAGGISSIIIALVTVSFQAIKAAIANPVKSLRSE